MSPQTKAEILEHYRRRYKKLTKKEKGKLLDEFCELTKYDRKHAIKLLGRKKEKHKKIPGKKIDYDDSVVEIIKKIWLATGQLCSKRLVEALPLWLPHYKNTFGNLSEDIKDKVLTISAATIDRKLAKTRAKYAKGKSGTKPGSLLKVHIPIKTDQWNTTEPGFVEADTVAHCGGSLTGDFVWSITLTDIFSGWTENRAIWGKGAKDVIEQIKDVEESIYFDIKGFDCDNGSEFLNWHLWRYFSDVKRTQPVQFTRSRPYHKDDNAHVEQKNWTHVRQLLGYDRFDNPKVLSYINDLYKNDWSLFQNYFLPSMKLVEKQRINSKIVKKHGKPSTPYQKLLNSDNISNELKKKLTNRYNGINPFHLKRSIERKLKVILKFATVSSVMSQ